MITLPIGPSSRPCHTRHIRESCSVLLGSGWFRWLLLRVCSRNVAHSWQPHAQPQAVQRYSYCVESPLDQSSPVQSSPVFHPLYLRVLYRHVHVQHRTIPTWHDISWAVQPRIVHHDLRETRIIQSSILASVSPRLTISRFSLQNRGGTWVLAAYNTRTNFINLRLRPGTTKKILVL